MVPMDRRGAWRLQGESLEMAGCCGVSISEGYMICHMIYADIFRYIQIYSDIFRYIQIYSDILPLFLRKGYERFWKVF